MTPEVVVRRLLTVVEPVFAGLLRFEPHEAGDEHVRVNALKRIPADTYAGAFEAATGGVNILYDPNWEQRDAIRSTAHQVLDTAQYAMLSHHNQFAQHPYFPLMVGGSPEAEWHGNVLRLAYRSPYAEIIVGEIDFSDQL